MKNSFSPFQSALPRHRFLQLTALGALAVIATDFLAALRLEATVSAQAAPSKQSLALLALLLPLASLHAVPHPINPINPNKTMTPETETMTPKPETMNEMPGDAAVKPLILMPALHAPAATDQVPAAMEPIDVPIGAGPCAPNWESLGDNFKVPTWWRQAKIGMWLHWGPQSVGEDGDWYAKWIYMPSHAWGDSTRVYTDHLECVGHPSVTGYKDMLPLWKAEK